MKVFGIPGIVLLRHVACVAIAYMLASSASSEDLSNSEVPFVGCPADGQVGPLKPPEGMDISIPIPPAVAQRLAYYQAKKGYGVLAPRGWHCRGWYGASGVFLIVTPQMIQPPYFPIPKITGPAVYVGTLDAGTSGRIGVAITAARLFSKNTYEFVEKIKGEGIWPAKDFDVKPFPADQLHYLGERQVEFTTPAGQDGLGTSGIMVQSALPIRGLVAIDPDREIHSQREVDVRLPADLADLIPPIIDWGQRCVLNDQVCLK